MKKCIICICDLDRISSEPQIERLKEGLSEKFMVGKFNFDKGHVESFIDLNNNVKSEELILIEDFGENDIEFFNDYFKDAKEDFIRYIGLFDQLFIVYHESNKVIQAQALLQMGFLSSETKTLKCHHGSGVLTKELLIELLLSSDNDKWVLNFNSIINQFPSEDLESLLKSAIQKNSYEALDNYLKVNS